MKKTIVIISLAFAAAFFSEEYKSTAKEKEISPEKSKEIIDKITFLNVKAYKKYMGIESKRKVITKEYDSKTDKLLHQSEAVVLRKDYFYEMPSQTVLSYRKDGKDMDVSEYKERKNMPTHPVFDENGHLRYDTRILGMEKINGINCFKIKISAKKKTERHIEGIMFYNTASLAPYYVECGIAKLSFPLTSFKMNMFFELAEDMVFPKKISMDIGINVPVVYSDKKLVIDIHVLESRGILIQ
jgi:ribosomal protein L22